MKTIQRLFFCGVVALSVIYGIQKSYGQTPEWEWAKSVGGNSEEATTSIATDKNGNVYVTGRFKSSSITFENITLNNTGDFDIYIVKYDKDGNVIWGNSASGSKVDFSAKVIVDSHGDIYLGGYFQSPSITFGNTTVINTDTSSKTTDAFIVKYNSEGDVLWVKGIDVAYLNDITIDENDNIYVTGRFYYSNVSFGKDILINKGHSDIFIVKYNTNGNVSWARSAGGSEMDFTDAITTDNNGNSYVIGSFTSPSITFGTTILKNKNEYEMFIVKYDYNGNVVWVKTTNGSGLAIGTGIKTDDSGNIYIGGGFESSSVTFGTTTLKNTKSGGFDIFLAKYDLNGNSIWAQSAGGAGYDVIYSIDMDKSGNIYSSGVFSDPSVTFGSTVVENKGYSDIFMTKHDSNGSMLWVKTVGGDGEDGGNINLDNFGNIYISGSYRSSDLIFGQTTLKNPIGSDIFIAKLSGNGTSITEEINTPTINLYPNPTKNTFHILGIEGNWNITVFTPTGEKVYSSSLHDSQIINLSGEAKGTYIYQLQKDSEIVKTGKIILE